MWHLWILFIRPAWAYGQFVDGVTDVAAGLTMALCRRRLCPASLEPGRCLGSSTASAEDDLASATMIDVDEHDGGALYGAMVRGRLAVERYFIEITEAIGQPVWHETDATSRLLLAVHPDARYIPFNPNQEGGSKTRTGVGADWLWWWIAPSGLCFGLLIQAKNLKRDVSGWSVDFEYRNRRQIIDLLEASDALGVPSAYALYCGPPEYRTGLDCGTSHSDEPDDRCHRSGVSILPALVANQIAQMAAFDTTGRAAVDAYRWALPLEDLVDPRVGPQIVHDLNLTVANEDVRDFLTHPQGLPLSIAKKIFAIVSHMRTGQFSSAIPALRESETDAPVFVELPADTGHFGVPYFEHVLRGVRRQPPSYVAEIAAGGSPPDWLRDLVDGIVVVDVT